MRRSAAIWWRLLTARKIGSPGCKRPRCAQASSASQASGRSARGMTTVSALSCEAFDRASVIRMPALVDAHEAGALAALADLLPVEPDQLRAAQRGAPAQRQQRGIAAADVARGVEHRQQVAHVGRRATGAAWRSTSVIALTRADPAPGHGDDPVLAVEGVAGVAVRQRHGGERLVDARPRQRAPGVGAVGKGREPRGDRLGRRRQGLAAVALAPAR